MSYSDDPTLFGIPYNHIPVFILLVTPLFVGLTMWGAELMLRAKETLTDKQWLEALEEEVQAFANDMEENPETVMDESVKVMVEEAITKSKERTEEMETVMNESWKAKEKEIEILLKDNKEEAEAISKGAREKMRKVNEMQNQAVQKDRRKTQIESGADDIPPLVRGNDSFLPQVMQGTTQGQVICGPEPFKVFRTTEDGVLHVDNKVNSTFLGINVFDSRHRGNLENNVRKTADEKVIYGTRPPRFVPASYEKKKLQSIRDRKEKLISTLRSESPPAWSEPPAWKEALLQPSWEEPVLPPPWKESVLPKTPTSNHASTAPSDVLVMRYCRPRREAQQYIDQECSDDPDLTKALKKQAIVAFLQYRKRISLFDLYNDQDASLQSGDDIADVPVKASVTSTKIENKTIPVTTTTAVEVSETGLASTRECMFFTKLPPEIRIQIYRLLLTTTAVLNAGADIENTVYTLTTDDNDPDNVSGVDSAVMRTCRKMYQETLPVLYGENRFEFTTKDDLEAFREGNLDTTQIERFDYHPVPVFNGQGDYNGRLSMVKDVLIRLSVEANYPKGDRHTWARLLGNESLKFPMLEFLTLDFTDWTLRDNQGLMVRPLIARFHGPLGLKALVIKGVTHRKSLEQLKKGLLREGGRFEVRGN